jgi:CarD family transcriptional regulator
MTKNSTSKAKAKTVAAKIGVAKSAVAMPGATRKSAAKVAPAAKSVKAAVSAAPRKAMAAMSAAASKRAAPSQPASQPVAAKLVATKAKAPAAVQSAAKASPVKSSAPMKPVQVKPVAAKVVPAKPAPTPVAAPAAVAVAIAAAAVDKKPVSQRHGFKTSEYVVYPAHGVGRIVSIEEQEIAGLKLELFVITFEKDKMTLRVPTAKTVSVGMRKLAETTTVDRAMETLKGRARIKRTMWSRRAQEYEAKINSGDLIAIAEVVRDLYRSESQPEQSYSERQLYEAALDRMAREVAAVEKMDDRGAVQKITEVLARSARGLRVERPEGTDGQDNHQAA